MDIFTLLKTKKNFTHNEQMIASFILEHPEQFLEMNTKQISQKCFVSPATIYRLCEKLNLSGLSELKVKISSSLHQYMNNSNEFDFDFPVKQNQTHYEIIHQLKKDYEETLLSTSQLFDLNQLRKSVHAMKKAQYIDVYTSAGNIHFALNFQFQMQEIGVRVHVPVEEYYQRITASVSDSTHFAILISLGGRGLLVDHILKILRNNHTPVLLISSYEYAQNQPCDYHLYMSNQENHYQKISSFATRLSILYILDVLYTCYFELDYDENIEKKVKYYHQMAK